MSTNKHTPGPWGWQLMGDTYHLTAQHGRREIIITGIKHPLGYPVVGMSNRGLITDVDKDHPNARIIEVSPDLFAAAEAAIKYDQAIIECANDPDKMASYCTAEGKDLDALYDDWISKSKEAIKKAKGE